MRIDSKDKVYFASDYHLDHKSVIKFDQRPFKNVNEMNDELIKRWNDVISDDDIVFYLGDLSHRSSPKRVKYLIDQLNGKIHLIKGNHDKDHDLNKIKDRFESIGHYMDLYVRDNDVSQDFFQQIVLFHYPIYSWNRAHYGSWQLHGHCHQSLVSTDFGKEFYKRKVLDMGCNAWDYKPVSYETIKDIMSKKEIKSVDHHEE
jgi:calcineurin-like phosphoesterase family protein